MLTGTYAVAASAETVLTGDAFAAAPSAMRPIAGPVPTIRGHYALWSGLAIALWASALVPILYFTARRRPPPAAPPPGPPPSIAERLKSSLLDLSQRPATAEDKIVIERLVLAAWRQRLRRPNASLGQLLSEINDVDAGRRTLGVTQRWLYGATPPDTGDVASTLADDAAMGGRS